jgi:hypothetical protein
MVLHTAGDLPPTRTVLDGLEDRVALYTFSEFLIAHITCDDDNALACIVLWAGSLGL